MDDDLRQARKTLIRDLLKQAADAHRKNDVDGILEHATDATVYVGNGWKNYRNVAVRGKAALAEMLWSIVIEYETIDFIVHDFVCDDQSVAFRRTVKLRKRGAGEAQQIEICAFVQFDGEDVTSFTEYFDTRQILAMDL